MKKCAITGCSNNTNTIPKKYFFCEPRNFSTRGLWIFATGKIFKENSHFLVCEDHFDMKEDIEYIRKDGKPALKKFIVPHLKLEETGQSAAGRSCATANILCSDRACQTDHIKLCNNGVQCNTVDSSTSTVEGSKNSSKPTESSGSFYIPDTDESKEEDEPESEDSEDELDEEFETGDESDDDVDDAGLDSYEKKVMCSLTLRLMKKNIQHYTGIPESSAYITDLIVERNLMSERDLFLVLRKIRHDESLQILGDLFGITRQQAGHIFNKDIEILAYHLRAFIYWPSSTDIKLNLPLQFKHKFKKVESIFDCFETSIMKPSHPVDQALTWSEYKHSNTLKHLISVTPDGMITFKSKGHTGRITDNEIVNRSGYLMNIKKGSETMADRGFKEVRSAIESKGGILHKPPSTQAGLIFTKEEAKFCKGVAATRIHVERVIKKLRDFAFLKPHRGSVHSKRTYLIEYALTVASAICNMQSYLTKI